MGGGTSGASSSPIYVYIYTYTFIHIPPPYLSPPGYWIEVISRDAATFGPTYPAPYTFAQTMLRVKDPKASLRFYRDLLGTDYLCMYVCMYVGIIICWLLYVSMYIGNDIISI